MAGASLPTPAELLHCVMSPALSALPVEVLAVLDLTPRLAPPALVSLVFLRVVTGDERADAHGVGRLVFVLEAAGHFDAAAGAATALAR